MTFTWPAMLFSLLAVPVFVLVYVGLQQRRKHVAARYGNFGLLQEAAGRSLGGRRHLPPLLFLAGLAVLMIAMARPQAVVSLPKVEGTVVLVFDVSGSMAADDLKPSRMEAARAAAREFVANQPSSVLIGVVAFSDGGFTVQAPTDDREAVLHTLERLTPQRGTALGQGISAALDTITVSSEGGTVYGGATPTGPTPTAVPPGTFSSAALVLLTDGENTGPPDPMLAAQEAARRGVRIYTIGIGSPLGATLQIEDFVVHTQLNEPLLRQIAAVTHGEYYNAGDEQQLHEIYSNLQPQLQVRSETTEITSLFAGAGVLVFLIGGFLSLAWFGRWP